VGIGDDVAVLKATTELNAGSFANASVHASTGEGVWLATCDVQVEGAHFLRAAIHPRNLGRKALAINLSDIASAGGVPRYALVSLGLPGDLEVAFIDELYAGLREEGSEFGVDIVGGNMSRSRLGVFVDIFLLGQAVRENVVLRSGACVGDLIMVTGSLGDAAAGVAMLLHPDLQRSTDGAYADLAHSRRDRPVPRVREGALIGSLRQASAMIDVSDGLAGDLLHICESSRTSFRLHADKLPVSHDNRAFSRTVCGDEWHFALRGGEDYELLFTAPPECAEKLVQQVTDETGTPVSVIGEIIPEAERPKFVLSDGSAHPLEGSGWDHFK
jgi:thiamine-monophosphate kinase